MEEEATLVEDYHKHSTRSCMHVGALLANTRVNPVFQLLFRLPRLPRGSLHAPLLFFPSHLFRALSLASSSCSCRCTVESAKRRPGVSRSRDFHARPTFSSRPSLSPLFPTTRSPRSDTVPVYIAPEIPDSIE